MVHLPHKEMQLASESITRVSGTAKYDAHDTSLHARSVRLRGLAPTIAAHRNVLTSNVAQLVEHQTDNLNVAGSTPVINTPQHLHSAAIAIF